MVVKVVGSVTYTFWWGQRFVGVKEEEVNGKEKTWAWGEMPEMWS